MEDVPTSPDGDPGLWIAVVVACVVAFGLALILRQLDRRFSARDHRARWVCNVAIYGGLLFLALLTWVPRPEGRRLWLVVPVLLAALLGCALWLGGDPVGERSVQSGNDRTLSRSNTLNLIADSPLLGTGLGTSGASVRRHEPTFHAWPIDQAPTEYRALGAEMGTLGWLLVVGGLGWFGWQTLRRWSRQNVPEGRLRPGLSAETLVPCCWDASPDGSPSWPSWRRSGMVAFSPVFLHDPPFQPPFAPRGLSRQTFRPAAGLRPNDSCSDASARPAWPSVLTGLAPLTSDHKGGQVGAQGPLTDATFRKIVARAGEAAKLGVPIHPHMPRHATGFKLAHDSRDTRAIQHTLGHKNIQHTVRDTELTTDRFKDFWPDERLAWCR